MEQRGELPLTCRVCGAIYLLLMDSKQEANRLENQHRLCLAILKKNLILPGIYIREGARILDLGMSTGIWAIEMAQKYPHADVFGIDASPQQTGQPLPANCKFFVCSFILGAKVVFQPGTRNPLSRRLLRFCPRARHAIGHNLVMARFRPGNTPCPRPQRNGPIRRISLRPQNPITGGTSKAPVPSLPSQTNGSNVYTSMKTPLSEHYSLK